MAKAPIFYNTSKVKKHDHVLFMGEDGTGITSEDNDHYHVGVIETDKEGQVVFGEDGKPSILLGQAVDINGEPTDSHTHEKTNQITTVKPSPSKQKEIALEVLSHWSSNRVYNEEFIKNADVAENMMVPSKQWDKRTKKKLQEDGKPCLSLPFMASNVMTMLGIYMSQATDISVEPMESSDVDIAGPVNALLKYVLHKNKAKYHARKAFEDQLIVGMGTLQARLDFINDPRGEIKIERIPWRDIDYGPHQLEDQSDMLSLTVSKFIAVSQLKAMYPEKAKMFDTMVNDFKVDRSSQEILKAPSVILRNKKNIFKVDSDVDKLRVIELHKIKRVKVPVLVMADGSRHNLELFPKQVVSKIETIPGLQLQRLIRKAIHITRAAGHVHLSESISMHSDFNIGASYGIKRDKDVVSFAHTMVDQQKGINKLTSQLDHYGNTMVGAGFQSPENSFKNKEAVRRVASGMGGHVEYDPDKGRGLERIEMGRPPDALLAMQQDQYVRMLQVANMQGFQPNEAQTSGVLESFRQRQALVGHEYQFDNMRLLFERLGKIILELMDKIYFKNPRRAARILLNSSVVQEQSDFDPTAYTEEQLVELLQRVNIAEFDLIIAESPHSKTQRQTDLLIARDLLQSGADPNLVVPLMMNLSGLHSLKKLTSALSQADDKKNEDKASTDEFQFAMSFKDDEKKEQIGREMGLLAPKEEEVRDIQTQEEDIL